MRYQYLASVLALSCVIPVICAGAELVYMHGQDVLALFAKWFLFSAIGLRLFFAGCMQLFRLNYTLHTIFKIQDAKSAALVQELGVHNAVIGFVTMSTISLPQYRVIMLVIGGLYFGAAGLLHVTRREKSFNQKVAMISDIGIAGIALLLLYLGPKLF